MKPKKQMTPEARDELIATNLAEILCGKSSIGRLLVSLRKKYLGITQAEYAKLVGVSLRTLSDIENDTADQTITTINKVFKPFGFSVGLLPTRNVSILNQALEKIDSSVK